MKAVCSHCHTPDYINYFYKQYDDLVILYNEKFAKPGKSIVDALNREGLLTPTQFDEEIEWTWFYLWHHEGRRARHGASMMAPDYTHWHGMYEVAERFYMGLIPQAREVARHGRETGHAEAAARVEALIDQILARPEHAWFRGRRRRPGREDPPRHGRALRPGRRRQGGRNEHRRGAEHGRSRRTGRGGRRWRRSATRAAPSPCSASTSALFVVGWVAPLFLPFPAARRAPAVTARAR